jgi:hypothetical protein
MVLSALSPIVVVSKITGVVHFGDVHSVSMFLPTWPPLRHVVLSS